MIKKLFIGAFVALSMMSCGNQDKQVESDVDKQATMDEMIMSRRSIRKWQDKTISRDTLDIIMSMASMHLTAKAFRRMKYV